jgi:hypothetical protein
VSSSPPTFLFPVRRTLARNKSSRLGQLDSSAEATLRSPAHTGSITVRGWPTRGWRFDFFSLCAIFASVSIKLSCQRAFVSGEHAIAPLSDANEQTTNDPKRADRSRSADLSIVTFVTSRSRAWPAVRHFAVSLAPSPSRTRPIGTRIDFSARPDWSGTAAATRPIGARTAVI